MARKDCKITPAAIVQLLLQHGADPNLVDATDGLFVTWQFFLLDGVNSPSELRLELMDILLSGGTYASLVFIEIFTNTSASRAPEPYSKLILGQQLNYGLNPNSKFRGGTVRSRYWSDLVHRRGSRPDSLSVTDFQLVKQLISSGADPSLKVGDKMVGQIAQEEFHTAYAAELLELLFQCVFIFRKVVFAVVYGKQLGTVNRLRDELRLQD
jgi:hypothetical protein